MRSVKPVVRPRLHCMSCLLRSSSSFRGVREAGTASHILRAALRAFQPGGNRCHLPGPSVLVAEHDEAGRVKYRYPLVGSAIDAQAVSMAAKIADVVEAFAAHGLRLTAQMRAEKAVSRAANAATSGALRTIMAISILRCRCSMFVPSRKIRNARLDREHVIPCCRSGRLRTRPSRSLRA